MWLIVILTRSCLNCYWDDKKVRSNVKVIGDMAVWFEIFSVRSEVPPWQRCKMNSCDWRAGGCQGLAPFLVREHLEGQKGHINTETSIQNATKLIILLSIVKTSNSPMIGLSLGKSWKWSLTSWFCSAGSTSMMKLASVLRMRSKDRQIWFIIIKFKGSRAVLQQCHCTLQDWKIESTASSLSIQFYNKYKLGENCVLITVYISSYFVYRERKTPFNIMLDCQNLVIDLLVFTLKQTFYTRTICSWLFTHNTRSYH